MANYTRIYSRAHTGYLYHADIKILSKAVHITTETCSLTEYSRSSMFLVLLGLMCINTVQGHVTLRSLGCEM